MGKETKYNIINILSYQLYEIERLIKKDVERGDMIYNYFINENKCKLLDFYQLETYLTETKIENLASLESISNLCIRINNLWNDDLKKLECKKLENPFRLEERLFVSWEDFYAIYISKIEFHYCTTQEEKKLLLLNKYKHYTLSGINSKCRSIRNVLVSFYPSLRFGEDPKQSFIQYKNFKELKFTPRPYKKYEYEKMKSNFNKHLTDCEYVFYSLDKNERHEFKTHIINNLNDVKNVQVLCEFKTLLSNTITLCNNDFKTKEPQPSTDNNTSIKPPSDEKKENQHTNIFKDNAFEVWQSMFDALKITETSRTDVRFTFKIMQKEDMIHNTVRYVDFLKWVNTNKDIAVEKISYANLNDKNRLYAFEQAKTNYHK